MNSKLSGASTLGGLIGVVLLAVAGTLYVLGDATETVQPFHPTEAPPRKLQVTTPPSSFDSSDSSSSSNSILEPSKSLENGSLSQASDMNIGFRWGGSGIGAGWTSSFTWLCLMLCFACIYHAKAVSPILDEKGTLDLQMRGMPETGKDDFQNNICQCFDDMWVCLHGCCCPLVRQAQTNAVSGVCGFWETIGCWFLCGCITGFGPCCLLVYWRMRLKDVMKIEDHCINDFCVTLFCPMLSICQMGTAVDRAMGYEVVGCCTLENTGPVASARDVSDVYSPDYEGP